MTEQQACTLCGAGGHTAAQCNWNGAQLIAALQTIADFPCAAQDNMPAANMRKIAWDSLEAFRQHPEQAEGAQGEMLPCPFCGESAEERADEPDGRGWFACSNNECPCWHLQAEARDWNARAALAQPTPKCVACEDLPAGENNPCVVCGKSAQPSPAPELERPEVVAWRWKYAIPVELQGSEWGWSFGSHKSTGPEDAEELMTVDQHERILRQALGAHDDQSE